MLLNNLAFLHKRGHPAVHDAVLENSHCKTFATRVARAAVRTAWELCVPDRSRSGTLRPVPLGIFTLCAARTTREICGLYRLGSWPCLRPVLRPAARTARQICGPYRSQPTTAGPSCCMAKLQDLCLQCSNSPMNVIKKTSPRCSLPNKIFSRLSKPPQLPRLIVERPSLLIALGSITLASFEVLATIAGTSLTRFLPHKPLFTLLLVFKLYTFCCRHRSGCVGSSSQDVIMDSPSNFAMSTSAILIK